MALVSLHFGAPHREVRSVPARPSSRTPDWEIHLLDGRKVGLEVTSRHEHNDGASCPPGCDTHYNYETDGVRRQGWSFGQAKKGTLRTDLLRTIAKKGGPDGQLSGSGYDVRILGVCLINSQSGYEMTGMGWPCPSDNKLELLHRLHSEVIEKTLDYGIDEVWAWDYNPNYQDEPYLVVLRFSREGVAYSLSLVTFRFHDWDEDWEATGNLGYISGALVPHHPVRTAAQIAW